MFRQDHLIGECFLKKRALRAQANGNRVGLPFALDRLKTKHVILAPVLVFGRPVGLYCILKRHFGGFHHEDSKNTKIHVIGRWK